MEKQTKRQLVEIQVTEKIVLSVREASFLREMAQFCVDKRMPGHGACQLLDRVLSEVGIPNYDDGPIYGLFED